MKILVVTGIFPPDIGGPATYVPQIAKGLSERGHEVTVLTLSEDLNIDKNDYPFRVIRLVRGEFKPVRFLRTMAAVWHLGQVSDLIFVNGLALESVLVNFVLRKPLVLKVVGDLAWEWTSNRGWTEDNFEDFQRKRYGWKVELLKALRAWWTRRAHEVIVPSRYLARWVQRWGVPEHKITVIYNAVKLEGKVKQMYIPLRTPIKAVTVARLVPWKGVSGLLRTLQKLPDLGLVVVGDGPKREVLERLARDLEVHERVHFAGQRSKKETLGLMSACDFFVLNSTYEGFPHVIVEALALGLPIVATNVGGTSEVIQDGQNGRLIPVLDDQTLYETIAKLQISMLERSRLADGAKKSANQFSSTRMLEKTERALEDAFRKSDRKPK